MNKRTFETPEDYRKYLMNQLGDERGQVFFRLRGELASAYDKWVVLRDIMENGIIIGNSSALQFFQLTEETYWQLLLVDIARLTERDKRGKNASTFLLASYVDNPSDKPVIFKQAKKAEKVAAPLSKLRNKQIAHSDKKVAIGELELSYSKVNLVETRNALDSIAEVLELFYFRILKPDSPLSMIRTRGWLTTSIEGAVGKLISLMVSGDDTLRPQFEFQQKIMIDEGPPQYIPDYY